MSDGELLDSVGIPVTAVTSGVETSTSPQRTYYVWKDPPQMAGYNSYPADNSSSPIRHASYASQVGYFLQQQQQQQQQQPQPIQLQSGGPRTTPSGYPGKSNFKVVLPLLLGSNLVPLVISFKASRILFYIDLCRWSSCT